MGKSIKKQAKKQPAIKKIVIETAKTFFWFITGAAFAAFLLTSFAFVIFQKLNSGFVYPGITIGGMDVGGQTQEEVNRIFTQKNEDIGNTRFTFLFDTQTATISAKDLSFGYNQKLASQQAIDLGRSGNFFSDASIILQAYFEGLDIQPPYHYSEEELTNTLIPFLEKVNRDPVDALFNFQNGKVTTFKPSEEGKIVDVETVRRDLSSQLEKVLSQRQTQLQPRQTRLSEKPQEIIIPVTVKTLLPKITTDKANNLGITQLIGKGSSRFSHSIPSRIFNIVLAASRINGILIAPGEIFSFNNALGDVSSFTGYQQAYIIQNGRTVLGDGGGVCQVSTTFFRAILDAGLPVVERHAHAYRVGYYEQDSLPGLDATIYVPTVDLKFKNDTNDYILIQSQVNQEAQEISVFFYGKRDGRVVNISDPVITNRIPPPEDLYQDDPTLPKGIIKQIDFKAEGARVSFAREVTKNGKKIITDKFISNYMPWRSVFLRGTKE